MNTSGTGTVFTIGYWVVLAMTITCAVQLHGDLGPPWTWWRLRRCRR